MNIKWLHDTVIQILTGYINMTNSVKEAKAADLWL